MGVSRAELRDIITEKAEVIAASLGLALWGVELLDGHRPLARIYLERDTALQNGEDQEGGEPCQSPEAPELPGDPCPETVSPEAADLESVSPEAVSVDECAHLSRLLGLALDVDDVFPDAWVLEVSSPGLERVFFRPGQMLPYVGREIAAALREPHPDFGDRRKFQGTLALVHESGFTLNLPDGSVCPIAWEAVRKAHLIHIFPDTSKPKPGAAKKARNAGQAGGNA